MVGSRRPAMLNFAKKYFSLCLIGLMSSPSALIQTQEAEKITIRSGTKFKASLQIPISSKLSEVGDTVAISLLELVRIDERHVPPRGMETTGHITFVMRPARVTGRAEVYALFTDLTTHHPSAPA